jgi:very-short-patch-repair endonuclease
VIEIDGPGFHRLKDDDARKTAAWRAAGLTVRRIPSDEVYDHPERYLALAPPRARRTRRTASNVGSPPL